MEEHPAALLNSLGCSSASVPALLVLALSLYLLVGSLHAGLCLPWCCINAVLKLSLYWLLGVVLLYSHLSSIPLGPYGFDVVMASCRGQLPTEL